MVLNILKYARVTFLDFIMNIYKYSIVLHISGKCFGQWKVVTILFIGFPLACVLDLDIAAGGKRGVCRSTSVRQRAP